MTAITSVCRQSHYRKEEELNQDMCLQQASKHLKGNVLLRNEIFTLTLHNYIRGNKPAKNSK